MVEAVVVPCGRTGPGQVEQGVVALSSVAEQVGLLALQLHHLLDARQEGLPVVVPPRRLPHGEQVIPGLVEHDGRVRGDAGPGQEPLHGRGAGEPGA